LFDPKALIGYIVNGQYRLASLCGTGSFGWVYAADEVAFGEVIGQVAVKLLRPPDDDARKAVIREVQAMAQLSHAHLLGFRSAGQVSDGLASGCLYIATELASETLEARLRQPGRMKPDEVREVAEHMASALAYLCERGAVHRDVKPANILRVGNVWKLGDFGLVRGFAGTAMQASGRKGTVVYMSPEAMQGETGPFVDVWALGAVIQECLTGALPYSGNSDTEIIAAALAREPTIEPAIPEPWLTAVRGCLTRDPHTRLTIGQLAAALAGPMPRNGAASTQQTTAECTAPTSARISAARRLLKDARAAEAIAELSDLIEGAPRCAEAYVLRADGYAETGEMEMAIADCSRAISIAPTYAEAYAKRALMYFDGPGHDIAKADADIRRALELDPACTTAYAARAQVRIGQNNPAGSRADADHVVQLASEEAESHYMRGLVYAVTGDVAEGLVSLSRAIQLEPGWAALYCSRGDAHQRLNQHHQAIADYDRAIELNPELLDAFASRGLSYLQTGASEQALADLSRAANCARPNPLHLALRAQIHLDLGHLDAAIADCSRAIEIDRHLGQAYAIRAKANLANGALIAAAADKAKAWALGTSE